MTTALQPSTDLAIRIGEDSSTIWFFGTRDQLDAEGLIQPGTVWPTRLPPRSGRADTDGRSSTWWTDDRFEYLLCREQRPGSKDWWCLARTTHGAVREQLRRAIDADARQPQPPGEPTTRRLIAHSFSLSQRDAGFQSFKAGLLGLRG